MDRTIVYFFTPLIIMSPGTSLPSRPSSWLWSWAASIPSAPPSSAPSSTTPSLHSVSISHFSTLLHLLPCYRCTLSTIFLNCFLNYIFNCATQLCSSTCMVYHIIAHGCQLNNQHPWDIHQTGFFVRKLCFFFPRSWILADADVQPGNLDQRVSLLLIRICGCNLLVLNSNQKTKTRLFWKHPQGANLQTFLTIEIDNPDIHSDPQKSVTLDSIF